MGYTRRCKTGSPQFGFDKADRRVTVYYFYILDAVFGLGGQDPNRWQHLLGHSRRPSTHDLGQRHGSAVLHRQRLEPPSFIR